jgi:hypothetical protein
LGQNLVNNPQNLSVYVGEKNISSNTPETRYDLSHALMFILVGRLPNPEGGYSATDKNLLSGIDNTAASFLGPILTNVLNSAGVTAISDVQIEKTYVGTKFNIAGRYKQFRYSLGGMYEEFKPNNADIKVEYIFDQNFSIRGQRKRPLGQTLGDENPINELGLKLKFEF